MKYLPNKSKKIREIEVFVNNFSTKGTWRAVFCTYLLAALFIMPETREVVGKLTYRRGQIVNKNFALQ